MKINHLKINGYGKLSNKEIPLDKKINVIYVEDDKTINIQYKTDNNVV